VGAGEAESTRQAEEARQGHDEASRLDGQAALVRASGWLQCREPAGVGQGQRDRLGPLRTRSQQAAYVELVAELVRLGVD
jgi:hypothetical protein